jgi:hypothetical protein
MLARSLVKSFDSYLDYDTYYPSFRYKNVKVLLRIESSSRV